MLQVAGFLSSSNNFCKQSVGPDLGPNRLTHVPERFFQKQINVEKS